MTLPRWKKLINFLSLQTVSPIHSACEWSRGNHLSMELLSLHSPLISALPSPRLVFSERPSFLSGQILPLTQTRTHPQVKIVRIFRYKARVSGSVLGTTESSLGTVKAVTQEIQQKDDNLAFVAGSTGRVGSRAVRELLKLGFQVRAAVRSKQKAESLAASVLQMGVEGGVQPIEKLEIVECDLENQEEIAPAIGNASVVLCCIGASEKEIFDITGPYRIDYLATKNLIDAAKVAKVKHFVLLTSLGTNKIGFPAAILNLFWGVLIWKRKAEESLLASGLPYTIVRPGGMERPTDSYKETHNMVLSNEDTLFAGQVSNLQVAELMAFMAKNRKLSFCKVVEVVAETAAPLTPMGDLLVKIPSQRVDSSISEELKSKSNDTEPSPAPIQEAPSPPVKKEPIQTETQKPRPLSPYTVYDDLKPPTSPSPTQSTAIGVTKESAADIGKTVVGSQAPFSSSGQIFKFTEIPLADKLENKQSHQPKSRPLSPFTMYEDLKPPRSPQASYK